MASSLSMAQKNQVIETETPVCKGRGCENEPTTMGFCRLCYLKKWKTLRSKQKKKSAKTLNKYINNVLRITPDGAKKSKEASNLNEEFVFERSLDDIIHHDSVRDVMNDLGYSENLDIMIDSIRIDENF